MHSEAGMSGTMARAAPAGSAPSIPRRLHVTWRTADLPARYRPFVQSWQDHNPDWTLRVWTDDDCRAFVAAEDPGFLPTFDGYTRQIARVDAVRYLILSRLGGVFVDLDLQCLRPIGPLLQDRLLVIGLEPRSHARQESAINRGIAEILCPTFMASAPGHPFWQDVRSALIDARGETDILDQTGPFLLSRVRQAYRGAWPVTVAPASELYPADKFMCEGGDLFDLEAWERTTRHAYAHHHWDGTWYRPVHSSRVGTPTALSVETSSPGPDGTVRSGPATSIAMDPRGPAAGMPTPLVSCLMVTHGRIPLARLAIDCFRKQTWFCLELVIVTTDRDDAVSEHVRGLGDPRIRVLRATGPPPSPGALRRHALEAARGKYVAIWDDGDLVDPLRIELQMRAMQAVGGDACFLSRMVIWMPGNRAWSISGRRAWEPTMICRRSAVQVHPGTAREEDLAIAPATAAGLRVAHLDLPRLYVHCPDRPDGAGPASAGIRFPPARWAAIENEMARRMPVSAYARARQALLPGLPVSPGASARRATTSGKPSTP